MIVRILAIALIAFSQTSAPNVYRSLESGKPARNAGTWPAVIVSVDYAREQLAVRERGEMRRLTVVPNTAIFRRGQSAAISDLHPGMRVLIAAYEVGGRLVAQTIRISP